MARYLNKKIGDMEFDGLITDVNPPVLVRGGVLAKLAAAATYKRGTILERNATDNKLYKLGTDSGNIPHSILCDDAEIGTAADVELPVYTAGCFHSGKVAEATGLTITEEQLDELRMRNIVFRLPHKEA